jgi:hypothetical protein
VRLWRAWVELTSERERGTTMALLRMAVAAIIGATVLSMWRSGLVDLLWLDAAHGGMGATVPTSWLSYLVGGGSPGVVWPLLALCLVSSAAMLVGLGGRLAVLMTLLSYRALSGMGVAGGYDAMILNAGWLLLLADCSATLSVDCRRRSGAWTSDTLVSAWPRYLFIFQLVVIYVFTGIQKSSASWTFVDGYSALYWFMQDPSWLRFDTRWVASVYPLTQVATALVWHFEVGAFLLLLVYHYRRTAERGGRLRALFNRRDLRLYFAAFGISMHIGIEILLNMGPFSWISMAYYLALWRPEEIEAAWRRMSRRRVAVAS